MQATKRQSKRARPKAGTRASARRSAVKPAAPLKLVGRFEQVLRASVQPDHGEPVREAAIETASKYLNELRTTDIIAITPVLVKYAATAGGPPGSDSA